MICMICCFGCMLWSKSFSLRNACWASHVISHTHITRLTPLRRAKASQHHSRATRSPPPLLQAKLRDQGVEVIEFDFLTPEAVADYCYSRGFLQVSLSSGKRCAMCMCVSHEIHRWLATLHPNAVLFLGSPVQWIGDLFVGGFTLVRGVDCPAGHIVLRCL
jgi:hypothetical protein